MNSHELYAYLGGFYSQAGTKGFNTFVKKLKPASFFSWNKIKHEIAFQWSCFTLAEINCIGRKKCLEHGFDLNTFDEAMDELWRFLKNSAITNYCDPLGEQTNRFMAVSTQFGRLAETKSYDDLRNCLCELFTGECEAAMSKPPSSTWIREKLGQYYDWLSECMSPQYDLLLHSSKTSSQASDGSATGGPVVDAVFVEDVLSSEPPQPADKSLSVGPYSADRSPSSTSYTPTASSDSISCILRRRSGKDAGDYKLTLRELDAWRREGKIRPMDEIWDPRSRTWSYAKNTDIDELLQCQDGDVQKRKVPYSLAGFQTQSQLSANALYILRRRHGSDAGDYKLSIEELKTMYREGAIQGMDEIWNPDTRTWSYAKNADWLSVSRICGVVEVNDSNDEDKVANPRRMINEVGKMADNKRDIKQLQSHKTQTPVERYGGCVILAKDISEVLHKTSSDALESASKVIDTFRKEDSGTLHNIIWLTLATFALREFCKCAELWSPDQPQQFVDDLISDFCVCQCDNVAERTVLWERLAELLKKLGADEKEFNDKSDTVFFRTAGRSRDLFAGEEFQERYALTLEMLIMCHYPGSVRINRLALESVNAVDKDGVHMK